MIDPIAMTSLAELSGNVGFGLVTIGAGLGIGLIGSAGDGRAAPERKSSLRERNFRFISQKWRSGPRLQSGPPA